MFLGALLDCGLAPEILRAAIEKLSLKGFSLQYYHKKVQGITAIDVRVNKEKQQPKRYLADIKNLIDNSDLPAQVIKESKKVFERLAEVEGKIHNVPPCKVHFHEVGALDSIIDIVGTLYGLHHLKIDRIYCSPIPLGRGWVTCSHGRIPLPSPAVLELLKGVPVYSIEEEGETITPTAAALLTTISHSFGSAPPLVIEKLGYGAGKQKRTFPNILRLLIGEEKKGLSYTEKDFSPPLEKEEVVIVEASIDDMNPEFFPFIQRRLFEKGALDVFLKPVIMKKGRPGSVLTAICPENNFSQLALIILSETTSLGIRFRRENRWKLRRQFLKINTPFGRVAVKYSFCKDNEGRKIINLAPEFEDCSFLAEKNQVPIKLIYDTAKARALQELDV